MSIVVKAEGISKNFGKIQALHNISFEMERAEIFGFIGADGAGKTTLFRILTTLMLPDVGGGRLAEFDIVKDFKEIRKVIGYMPGVFSLYMDLSVEENLTFFAAIYGTTIKENYEMIKDIYSQLEPFKNRKARALSGGMKQKLALCCALVHRPEILFLDEPTTGVDPVSRREFWKILKQVQKGGISVLVSTPYMDEASLCDKIALIHEGEFLTIDTPNGLVSKFDKKLFALRGGKPGEMLYAARAFSGVESCFAFGDNYHIIFKNEAEPSDLLNFLESREHKNLEINSITPNIEDCFMEFLK